MSHYFNCKIKFKLNLNKNNILSETNDKYNNLQSLLSKDFKMNKSYDKINDNDYEILYSFYRNEIKIISDQLVGNRTIASDLYTILLCTVSIILNTIVSTYSI